jgi:hypothetical protein
MRSNSGCVTRASVPVFCSKVGVELAFAILHHLHELKFTL